MSTYTARFTATLSDKLGAAYTVADMGHNLFNIEHAAGMQAPVWGPQGCDKRKPVRPADVAEAIESAARTLRRNFPHYTPEAQAEAAAFLAGLPVGSDQ